MGHIARCITLFPARTGFSLDAAEQTLFRQSFVSTAMTLPLQIELELCSIEIFACSWSHLSRCYIPFNSWGN